MFEGTRSLPVAALLGVVRRVGGVWSFVGDRSLAVAARPRLVRRVRVGRHFGGGPRIGIAGRAGLVTRVGLLVLMVSVAGFGQTMKLTLEEAEQLAVKNHPAIASAKFVESAAGEVVNETRSAYQPVLFGSLTGVGADTGSRIAAGALNNPVIYNRIGTGVTLNQLVTDFGRTSNLVSSAKLRAQAQGQYSETVRANILLETDRAYFAVLRASALLTVTERTVEARQVVVDQVSALAASKLKSQLDVSFANVNLSDAKLQLADARNGLKSAAAQLATAIGLPQQQDFQLADVAIPASPPDKLDGFLAQATQNRPELSNLRLQAEAAERFVKAERALSYPTVGVVATVGAVPAGQEQIPGKYGAIGANLNIPIFNGGLFKARRNEAEYRAMSVNKDLEDLQNRVARDVRVAYLNALNAYERVGLTAQLLEQARLGLDLAQQRYDLGLGSIVELSQAQLQFTSAQIANTSAKYDYRLQFSVLQYQTGMLR